MSDYKELIFPKHSFVLRFYPVSLDSEEYCCSLSAYDIDNFQKWINEDDKCNGACGDYACDSGCTQK